MGVKISGEEGVFAEYRMVGDYTYYRADMHAIGDAMGMPFPTADELDELPEGKQHLRPVLEGDWVKVNTADLQDAAEDAGAGSGSDGSDELDAKTQKKILDAVRGVVAREVDHGAIRAKTEEGAAARQFEVIRSTRAARRLVPARYASEATSGLSRTVEERSNTIDLDLED